MVRRVPTAQRQGLAEYRFGLVGTLSHQVDLTQPAVESGRGRPPFDQCIEPVDGPVGISPLRPFQCPLRGAEPLKRGEPHENDRTGHESDHEEHLSGCQVDLSFPHPGRTSIHQCIVTTSADHA